MASSIVKRATCSAAAVLLSGASLRSYARVASGTDIIAAAPDVSLQKARSWDDRVSSKFSTTPLKDIFKFVDLLEEHLELRLSRASVSHRGKNLYMQAPPVLEEMTRSNLSLTLFNLMGKPSRDIVQVNGTATANDQKVSCLRKLSVVFKGIDGVTDMDTAGGA